MAFTSEYPLTKMNFVVSVQDVNGTAAFTEVTGIEANVDVIEFRMGNSSSLAPRKLPGLVKHGNVTMKMGYISGQQLMEWAISCVKESRAAGAFKRHDVTIELLDIATNGTPTENLDKAPATGKQWKLTNAWVAKYHGADLDAKNSDVAIQTIEIAYEELVIPN